MLCSLVLSVIIISFFKANGAHRPSNRPSTTSFSQYSTSSRLAAAKFSTCRFDCSVDLYKPLGVGASKVYLSA